MRKILTKKNFLLIIICLCCSCRSQEKPPEFSAAELARQWMENIQNNDGELPPWVYWHEQNRYRYSPYHPSNWYYDWFFYGIPYPYYDPEADNPGFPVNPRPQPVRPHIAPPSTPYPQDNDADYVYPRRPVNPYADNPPLTPHGEIRRFIREPSDGFWEPAFNSPLFWD